MGNMGLLYKLINLLVHVNYQFGQRHGHRRNKVTCEVRNLSKTMTADRKKAIL